MTRLALLHRRSLRWRFHRALAIGLLASATSGSLAAAEYTELAVYPPHVSLSNAQDSQRLVAVATRDDGVTRDVTAEVQWAAGPEVEMVDGVVRARTNGATRLTAAWEGLASEADVHVSGAEEQPAVSFRHDVIPVFMQAGCNAGGCHGASRGKDGFRLSLFGFDPSGDHFRLTRELATRRINRALPEESLLLQKATGAVPHTGGKRFDPGSAHYQKIRDWIAAGAVSDVATAPKVDLLEIFPPRAVLEGTETSQQFIAVATYSDGSTRDVTDLAVFESNNASAAAISPDGMVRPDRRGEAFVMARFDTHTVGSQVLTLPADVGPAPQEDWSPANYVDELVDAKLRTLRITPSELCTDEEFLRRVTIDVAGSLPTADEYAAFLADASPDKRAAKIDELLQRRSFAEIWGMKWSELLMVRTEPNRVDYKPMFLYGQWVTQQIADGVPLDQMVRALLGASGGSFTTPAVNFYQIEPQPQKTAENVAQVFLGIRIQCAQCHNHPFDRWTMDDYYGFTAFFAQIGRKAAEDYRETIVFDRGSGETNHPLGGRVMAPKFLGGETPDVKNKDRRAVVAQWIASPENPYFAGSVANRVWAHFLGIGVVEPVDDIRVSNPASNPQLFAALGERLVEYNYDLRQLVRDICNSNAYQRSAATNPSNAEDLANFSHARIRRIPAETLIDCVVQVTESPEQFPGLPLGAKAVQIADGRANHYFLKTFGRARRDTVCACEAKAEPTLSQALHLLNGNTVHGKVAQGKLIERRLEEGKSPSEVLDELYIRCLSRKPFDEERTGLAAVLGEDEKPVAELQDVFWAVLNSREFLFNH